MFSSTIDVAVRLPIKQLMQSFPTDVAAEKDMVQIVTGTIRHHLSEVGPSLLHSEGFPCRKRENTPSITESPPPSTEGKMLRCSIPPPFRTYVQYNTRYG